MFNYDDRILIVTAHPDDEVLGCGGTIKRYTALFPQGAVHCVILSEGLTSRDNDMVKFTTADIATVKKDTLNAAKLLGINHTYFADLPNNRLDSMDLLDVIKIVEQYVAKIQPTVVFTHHHSDINIAHRITYQAVLTACRPLENCTVRKLLSFEIPSSTEWAFPTHKSAFSPNLFVEIGDEIETKIDAMHCYASERRKYPHPRSPEALRGYAVRWGSVANMDMAEAFELIYERDLDNSQESRHKI